MARILVVDDEPDIGVLVKMTLEGEGHQVSVAADGEAALALVDGEAFDAVILDVTMPGMDGFEVLTAIKSDPEPSISSIPVIMLTARTADLDRIRGGIEGAVAYMTKPFTGAELRDQLNQALVEGSEPSARRAAQRAALEHLARIERGGAEADQGRARPRLSRLDRPPAPPVRPPASPTVDPEAVAALSAKQKELLCMVRDTRTVQEAAERLHVSRSNVYASLRRIARRLAVPSVPELVAMSRQGLVIPAPS
jgi:CheY-like chemotaxis protein